jgi:membrane-associated phospholipid phosphatase
MFGASRGIGVTEAIYGNAPDIMLLLFALLTQLGDGWFLFVLAGTIYIGSTLVPVVGVERDKGLFVFGVVLAYSNVSGALKGFFQSPRPPSADTAPTIDWLPAAIDAVFTPVAMAGAPGTGFPSGHALGASAVWGAIALVSLRGSRVQRFGVASLAIGIVSLSRLVLGLHYLVDVIVGTAIGVTVVSVCYLLSDRGQRPEFVVLLAVLFGVAGVVVDYSIDTVAVFGLTAGGLLAWFAVSSQIPPRPATSTDATLGILSFVIAGIIFIGSYELSGSLLLVFFGTTVAGALAVGAPLIGSQASTVLGTSKS